MRSYLYVLDLFNSIVVTKLGELYKEKQIIRIMACNSCKYEKIVVEIGSVGNLCGRCLNNRIISRIKKELRELKLKHEDTINVKKGQKYSKLAYELISKISQERGLKIGTSGINLSTLSAEQTAAKFLKQYTQKIEFNPQKSIFETISETELNALAKHLNIEITLDEKTTEITEIYTIEKRHNELITGMIKGINEITKINLENK